MTIIDLQKILNNNINDFIKLIYFCNNNKIYFIIKDINNKFYMY